MIIYTSVGGSGNIILNQSGQALVFSGPQNPTEYPNLTAMSDTDPRWISYLSTEEKSILASYAGAVVELKLALQFSYALSDLSATLTSACDSGSLAGLNSLTLWASIPALQVGAPTRQYNSSDGSTHTITPAEMTEFSLAVGNHVDALWGCWAAVMAGILSGSISTPQQVDEAKWT